MTYPTTTSESEPRTYLGVFGSSLPLLTMIGGMIILVAVGQGGTKGFWVAGYATLVVSFLIFRDKDVFQKALIEGIRDNVFAYMIACFLLAGVLAKILTFSHLVDSLLYFMGRLNVPVGLIPLVCFLITVVLSVSTGSAAAAINTAGPVMVPLGVAVGVDPGLLCGALLSGAVFGDNLAPISDTTIASSLTQEAEVSEVVRSRFKYAIIAGVASAVLFVAFGFLMPVGGGQESAALDATYVSSIAFLVVPVLVLVLMLRGAGLFTSLLVSEIVGLVMLFAFGYLDFTSLVSPKDGLVVTAFEGMLSSIVFILFIFVMVSLIKHSGFLDYVLRFLQTKAKSAQSAEVVSGAMVTVMSVAISSGTTAIAFCGPIVNKIARPFRLDRRRSANILDGLGCGTGYLVPTNPGCLNLAAVAVASGAVAEGFSPVNFVVFNFHSMALFVVFWFAILTGWGRTLEDPDAVPAQAR
mgnify:CR=1 FL=1